MSVKAFLNKYFKTDTSSSLPQPQPPPSESSLTVRHVVEQKVQEPAEQRKEIFHIFTDGACSDNGRRGARGGFGVHFYSDRQTPNLDISEPLMNNEQQTNNRGELRAIQSALDAIEKYGSRWMQTYDTFYIWSDSEYSIHSLTKWAAGWKRNGWKKGDGGLIQNLDLIKPIYTKLSSMPYVHLRYVKAHNEGKKDQFPWNGNHEADRLARLSVVKLF
jgi:ribonuclease HI